MALKNAARAVGEQSRGDGAHGLVGHGYVGTVTFQEGTARPGQPSASQLLAGSGGRQCE